MQNWSFPWFDPDTLTGNKTLHIQWKFKLNIYPISTKIAWIRRTRSRFCKHLSSLVTLELGGRTFRGRRCVTLSECESWKSSCGVNIRATEQNPSAGETDLGLVDRFGAPRADGNWVWWLLRSSGSADWWLQGRAEHTNTHWFIVSVCPGQAACCRLCVCVCVIA